MFAFSFCWNTPTTMSGRSSDFLLSSDSWISDHSRLLHSLRINLELQYTFAYSNTLEIPRIGRTLSCARRRAKHMRQFGKTHLHQRRPWNSNFTYCSTHHCKNKRGNRYAQIFSFPNKKVLNDLRSQMKQGNWGDDAFMTVKKLMETISVIFSHFLLVHYTILTLPTNVIYDSSDAHLDYLPRHDAYVAWTSILTYNVIDIYPACRDVPDNKQYCITGLKHVLIYSTQKTNHHYLRTQRMNILPSLGNIFRIIVRDGKSQINTIYSAYHI